MSVLYLFVLADTSNLVSPTSFGKTVRPGVPLWSNSASLGQMIPGTMYVFVYLYHVHSMPIYYGCVQGHCMFSVYACIILLHGCVQRCTTKYMHVRRSLHRLYTHSLWSKNSDSHAHL